MSYSQAAFVKQLAQRIREIEGSEPAPGQAAIPLGIPGLPARGLPAGSLVELLEASGGAGAWTLALVMAKHACERKLLVLADGQRCFYPPAAVRLGVELGRTLVIRPKSRQHVLGALVQSLRCPAVGAVVGELDSLSSMDFRRLQLAAEAGGGLGVFLRPAAARGVPSFAALRLAIAPAPWVANRRRLHVEVLRLRGGKSGQSFFLEIDDETGHVHLPAAVAAPKIVARPARPAP